MAGRSRFGLARFGSMGSGSAPTPPTVVDLREGLRAFLLADSTLTAIIGNRVRPGVFNQGDVLPGIAYRVLSNVKGTTLDGDNATSRAVVELAYYSRDVADVVEAKRRVDTLLHGFNESRGTMGGVVVMIAVQDGESDDHEFPEDASDRAFYRLTSQFLILHRT